LPGLGGFILSAVLQFKPEYGSDEKSASIPKKLSPSKSPKNCESRVNGILLYFIVSNILPDGRDTDPQLFSMIKNLVLETML
jgi:hypothetical protein